MIIVIKTRLQVLKKHQGETTYTGIGNAFVRIYQNEGILAFFKGAGCRIMVISPLFGIAQTVYYLGVAEKLLGIPRIIVSLSISLIMLSLFIIKCFFFFFLFFFTELKVFQFSF